MSSERREGNSAVSVEMGERGESNTDQATHSSNHTRPLAMEEEDTPVVVAPRPFKNITQVLTLTYMSVMCCLCVGAYANRQAWKANNLMNKGNPTAAKRSAAVATRVAYVGILLGIALFSTLISIIVVTWKYTQ